LRFSGRWNGFGGKVEAGETIEQAARRELTEEIHIEATNASLSGIVTIIYHDTAELADGLSLKHSNISKKVEMYVYRVTAWNGSPIETDEMAPKWFNFKDIPYENMWPDDRRWLPLVLDGKQFEMECSFQNQNTMLSYKLKELQPSP